MKKFLILLCLITQIQLSCAKDLETMSTQVLDLMEEISSSWKLIKDKPSLKTQIKKSKEIVNELSKIALQLNKLDRPSNELRLRIKNANSERIEKIGIEMAQTIVKMQVNAPIAEAFENEINTIMAQMQLNQKVFDIYFEPERTTTP